MSQPAQNPSEIAREVLHRLAANRIPPTPDNFRRLYEQISGTPGEESFPERELRALAVVLPRHTPEQVGVARRFESAIAEHNWSGFRTHLREILDSTTGASLPWAALIRDLLLELERRHAGITRTRKEEVVRRILARNERDPQQLYQRLSGLVRGWRDEPTTSSFALIDAPSMAAAANREHESLILTDEVAATTFDMRMMMAKVLEEAVCSLLIESPELTKMAGALAEELRTPTYKFDVEGFAARIHDFTYKIEWLAQDQAGTRQGLVKLLRLIIENINDLVLDDRWLQGQMAGILAVTDGPLDRKAIETLGHKLRDLILRQGLLKQSLDEAQERLRELLASFIDHLTAFSDSADGYRDRIEHSAALVANAGSINELSAVIGSLVDETRAAQLDAEMSRGNLAALREQVEAANNEIGRLQDHLAATSDIIRHDALTGALNRKGMDEALEREIVRARRKDTPLCIALLDLDDFRLLNEQFGDDTGDDALVHMTRTIGDFVRPQDTLARYEGAKFVVVLPDTRLQNAAVVIRRLQREVTRRFFLHENRKLLITFSAGVCELHPKEAPQHALDRADEAMYKAKRAGKNRVEIAD